MSRDFLTPQLRAAETEIDRIHLSNPLLKLPLHEALWHLFAYVDDFVVYHPMASVIKREHLRARADTLVNGLRYAAQWLYESCPPGGGIPTRTEPDTYMAAAKLVEHGMDYITAVYVFTRGSRGLCDLDLVGTIITERDIGFDTRYGPYYVLSQYTANDRTEIDFQSFRVLVTEHLQFTRGRLVFRKHDRLLSSSLNLSRHVLGPLFVLPSHWKFARYSLREFQRAVIVLHAYALIRWMARHIATDEGVPGMGVDDYIELISPFDLSRSLVRRAGITAHTADAIIEDLTLGGRGLAVRDPALQPLIPMGKGKLGIPSGLWINLDMERNHITLLNKIPEERLLYAGLVDEKEVLMRQHLIACAEKRGYVTWYGGIPGRPDLPDIDLAIIEPTTMSAIVLELKWFIEPAEPREVWQKNEEIAKGMRQLHAIKSYVALNAGALAQLVNISKLAFVGYAVVSKNSIGSVRVQDDDIPAIQMDHLAGKIGVTDSLFDVIGWLDSRSYLPIAGIHFDAVVRSDVVGDYTIQIPGFICRVTPKEFIASTL